MNASIRSALLSVMLIACATAGVPAGAAPSSGGEPLPFDRGTWASLQAQLGMPTAVVFTTTDCAHCPAAFDRISRHLRTRAVKAALIGVVMDDAAPDDLRQHPHYRRADRLYVFADTPAALRHGVNPAWRGVTPYVALLTPGRPPIWITGTPDVDQLDAWLARSTSVRH